MTSARHARLVRWYPLLLALSGVVLSIAVYRRLPATMTVHWDLDGNPNGWMPRAFGAFFGPVFLLVLWQLMRLAPRLDQRLEQDVQSLDAYEAIVAAALLLVLATHVIVLAVALGYHVPVRRLVPALVGALFVVMGRVMPRVSANRWLGVRTPWTLADERVWARTHQLAGVSTTAAGVLMILAALALPASLGLPVVLAAAVAAVVGPAVYSYLTWRRAHRR